MRKPHRVPTLILVAAGLLSACSVTPEDAQRELKRSGYDSVTIVRQKGNGFEFKAKKDGNRCTGAITIEKGLRNTNSNIIDECTGAQRPPSGG